MGMRPLVNLRRRIQSVYKWSVSLAIVCLSFTFIQILTGPEIMVNAQGSIQSQTSFSSGCEQCSSSFNVNGQELYLEKMGNQGPIVVLEAGLGNGASSWKSIDREIAKFAQVVLYDRAGIGKSSPRTINSNSPITADEVATSLNQLLKQAKINPPYILVGHSLGGLYVQMFARKYPDQMAGVVLLDASSPNEPEGVFVSRSQFTPGSTSYFEDAGATQSMEQVRNAGPFPDIPLTVMTATKHGSLFTIQSRNGRWWMELQRGMAAASPQGKQIIAEGSDHYIQDDRPTLVIDAIKSMTISNGSDSF